MIIYSVSKKGFISDVQNDLIEDVLERTLLEKMNKKTSVSEKNSWMNSLMYMYKVLNDDHVPDDAGIAIEYSIPNTSKRVDFIITGEDNLGGKNVVIVELKQWQDVEVVSGQDAIVKTRLGGGLVNTTHPSYQAWSYASLIKDYNENVRDLKMELKPCAYLHNYKKTENDALLDPSYAHYIEKAPVFTRGDANKLKEFISRYVKFGNKDILFEIEHGRIKPSKSLQNTIASLLRGNQEFNLIDEQKVVFEKALDALKTDAKKVMIVEGGPGTGKTVLAINLLSKALNQDKNAIYVSKNSAPRSVFTKKLVNGKFRRVQIDNLFKGSGSFTESQSNDFDCIIVDEAHRLNEKSGMFKNIGENQIKEIINASNLSIFFIDEKQKVTLSDIGSTDEIRKWAKHFGAEVITEKLFSQFRCNGSDGYLAWLDNVLEIEETANYELDDSYDFQVFDSPKDVKEIIESLNHNNGARLVAGYCWDWIKKGRSDTSVHDINIDDHDFHMSWNLNNSTTWAIDPTSVSEVGCIHTCQGLEFEYVGVIIGDDIRYENGKIVTDFSKRASTDQSLKGIKKLYKEDSKSANIIADKIIKNTYRTLMSRGMKGCYVYCKDENLRDYIRKSLTFYKTTV